MRKAAAVLAFCACFLFSPAYAAGDKDALVEQEKALLMKSDSLSRKIFNTKKAINELYDYLDVLQDDYADVKHSLIDVHLRIIE